MIRPQVLIFAKYPQPGEVKTRMVPPLSHEEAAGLHRACLQAVCERVGMLSEIDAVLVGTPDERLGDLRELVGDRVRDIWPQGDGDLGQRMSRAVDRAFDAGAKTVILLGADSPTLPLDRLRAAIDGQQNHEAVLGPAEDGGYYLLGLRRKMPTLFDGIDWGADDVADRTRARAAAANISLHELATWGDLDYFADLRRALQDLDADDVAASLPMTSALRTMIHSLIERHS